MEENKDDVKREPVFDLYNHLKCNIKSCCNSCEIHDSEFTTYCLQCKRSICDVCLEAFHSSHNSTLKSNIKMSKEDIENAFMQLDTQIKENTAFYQPEKIKEYLKSTLTKEIEELYEKVEYYKLLKIKEIDESFKNNSGEALTLLSYIKEGKAKLSEFYLEFKSFFKGQGVSDEDNFIFLLNYDLLNEALNAGKEYSQILDEIKNYFKTCSCMDTGQLKEVIELVEIKIQQQLKISELNEKVLDEVIEINPKISKPSTKNLINLSTKNLPNPSLQKASSSSNSVGPRSNKKKITSKQLKILPTFNEEDFLKKKEERKKYIENLEKFSENKYQEIAVKTSILKEFVLNFKESVYLNFKKHGSMIEIEKLVKLYEEKSNKRLNLNNKTGLKFSNSQAKSGKSVLTRSKATFQTMKKEPEEKSDVGEESEEEQDKSKVLSPIKDSKKEKKDEKSIVNTNTKLAKNGANLEALVERENESNSDFDEKKSESDNSDYLGMVGNEEIEVKIENNVKMQDQKIQKREKMFKPLKRLYQRKSYHQEKKLPKKEQVTGGTNDQFKVNNKLVELIKENQKLTNMIKTKDDICLQITTIRRYFAFMLLEFVRKNYKLSNKLDSNLFLNDSKRDIEPTINYSAKFNENGNQITIYNRNNMTKEVKTVTFNKKKLGVTHFLAGSRHCFHSDRIYITGGKMNGEATKFVFCYLLKDNKLVRMTDMNFPRAYHTIVFHENLKSLIVVGGEENATCEMYDFFLNSWTAIPSLTYPRANVNLYIDKLGTFAYALCGMTGSITNGNYSDIIEFLDLIDMNQGWGIALFKNKAEVNLKLAGNKFVPISEDKLVIYGGNEARQFHRCYCLFDLKKFEITKLDKEDLEHLKAKIILHPDDF